MFRAEKTRLGKHLEGAILMAQEMNELTCLCHLPACSQKAVAPLGSKTSRQTDCRECFFVSRLSTWRIWVMWDDGWEYESRECGSGSIGYSKFGSVRAQLSRASRQMLLG